MSRSPVIVEVGWLAYFFVVFAIAMYVMAIFVVPHHFNDRIADVLAGLFAGLAMIGTRAWVRKRAQK